jgi:imidazolonepropionase-like amidohydrolase
MTRTAFTGGTLIDGTGAAPVPEAALVVEHGRIAWSGRASELPDDVDPVDVSGKWVIPGLLDANVHLLLDNEPEVLLCYEPGHYDELILEAAQVTLTAGVTTVFDTWGPLEALRRVRERIAGGELVGSRIYCAGNIIGNGGPWTTDFLGLESSLSREAMERVNSHWEQGVGNELVWMPAEDARAAVRAYIARSGIDFVKYASSSHHELRFLAFSPRAQQAICDEAHDAGLTAQACTITPEALRAAIEAGVDLLPHGNITGLYPMPQDTLDLIVDRQLPCVALFMTDRHLEASSGPGVWSRVLQTKDGNDRRLIEAGAKLCLATDGGVWGSSSRSHPVYARAATAADSPVVLGESHVHWLRAAFERGMKPMDALQAATRNVAEAYRVDDEVGTLEIGKRADVLVLDDDPLVDPEAYGHVALVVKDGELVDRDRLPERPVLTAAR